MIFYTRLLFTSLSIIFSVGLLSGCSNQQTRSASNLVDYLYPKEQSTQIKPDTPNLKLPLKIGIAFVPAQSPDHYGRNEWTGGSNLTAALTEAKKINCSIKLPGISVKKNLFPTSRLFHPII